MADSQPTWPVMRVVGKSVFWVFAMVTFLIVAILAASNLISKYALKTYAEEQIARLQQDAIVYQNKEVLQVQQLRSGLQTIPGISKVGLVGTMRLRLGTGMKMHIGGAEKDIPWCVIVSFEDDSHIPVAFRSPTGGVPITLVSTEAYLTPQEIESPEKRSLRIEYTDPDSFQKTEIFQTSFDSVSQTERMDLVQWFLEEYGAATFIPDQSVFVVLPKATFDAELPRVFKLISMLTKPFDRRGLEAETAENEAIDEILSTAMRIEIMHLVSMDRTRLFTGWDLEGSRERVTDLVSSARHKAKEVNLESFVNSDLKVTLDKMSRASRLVGLLTILITIPILWMAWYFAGNLTRLVILNQRRLVGMLRLRGTSFQPIRRSLLAAIAAGGVLGGLAGSLAGTFVPYFLYRAGGVRIPGELLFRTIQNPLYLILFIAVGTLFSLIAGKRIIDYMATITPLEASRRVASSEGNISFEFLPVHSICLVIGSVKLLGWIVGFTPKGELLQRVDMFANFIAVPLFVYGLSALVVSRSQFLQWVLNGLSYPIGGSLKWFAVTDMLSRPARVMSVILIAALAFSVIVYPRITADSFYDKAVRGLRMNMGAEIAVRFDGTGFLPGVARANPVTWYQERMGSRVEQIEQQLRSIPGVQDANALYKFHVPGSFYIPGKNLLQLYLVADPDRFINSVHFDDRLGDNRPFHQLVQDLGKDQIILSKGFAAFYGDSQDGGQEAARPLMLGRSAEGANVEVPVAGVTYLLPGTMQMMLADRESYSRADVEFLNSVTQTNPYVVGRMGNATLGRLNAFLAGVVFVVKTSGDERATEQVAQQISQLSSSGSLPEFAEMTTESAERRKLGNDMFVYLGLENMKVFMIGGLLTAACAIIAIAWVNFVERRRTFALLRIRGASPSLLLRVILSQMMVPVIVGSLVGIAAGMAAGYGLTTAVFTLPKVSSILEILRVHLIVGSVVGWIIVAVFLVFLAVVLLLGSWVFRYSAREAIQEG